MSFKVGDKAVYPVHGLARITDIEEKIIGGTNQSFYVLEVISSGVLSTGPFLISLLALRLP